MADSRQQTQPSSLDWRMEVIYRIFHRQSILAVWGALPAKQQVELYNFIWEKTLELGMVVKGKEFTQEELLSQLNKIAMKQFDRKAEEKWTDLRIYIDESTIETARTREQIDLLSKVLDQYLFGD
ncbi:hypothetical protein GF406_11255 [candidate division KSB1 bacterium]|nr:hypothetical protein [candidate division KSB1 bacterium]